KDRGDGDFGLVNAQFGRNVQTRAEAQCMSDISLMKIIQAAIGWLVAIHAHHADFEFRAHRTEPKWAARLMDIRVDNRWIQVVRLDVIQPGALLEAFPQDGR